MKCMGDFGEFGRNGGQELIMKKRIDALARPSLRPTGPVKKPVLKPGKKPVREPVQYIKPARRPTGPITRPALIPTGPVKKPAYPYDRSPGSTLKSPVKPSIKPAIKPTMTQQAKDILSNLTKPKTAVLQTTSPAVAVLSNTSNAVAITSSAAPTSVIPGTTVQAPQATISQAPKGNTGMVVGGLAVAGLAAYMFMKD